MCIWRPKDTLSRIWKPAGSGYLSSSKWEASLLDFQKINLYVESVSVCIMEFHLRLSIASAIELRWVSCHQPVGHANSLTVWQRNCLVNGCPIMPEREVTSCQMPMSCIFQIISGSTCSKNLKSFWGISDALTMEWFWQILIQKFTLFVLFLNIYNGMILTNIDPKI